MELSICKTASQNNTCFILSDDDFGYIELEESYKTRCNLCHKPIVPKYKQIIETLKENKLIPQNYPLMCCDCYNSLMGK